MLMVNASPATHTAGQMANVGPLTNGRSIAGCVVRLDAIGDGVEDVVTLAQRIIERQA